MRLKGYKKKGHYVTVTVLCVFLKTENGQYLDCAPLGASG